MKAFTVIRVEVNAGDGKFVPLIDGPVVGFDSARSALPGKSEVTVVVHDDSALLNRAGGRRSAGRARLTANWHDNFQRCSTSEARRRLTKLRRSRTRSTAGFRAERNADAVSAGPGRGAIRSGTPTFCPARTPARASAVSESFPRIPTACRNGPARRRSQHRQISTSNNRGTPTNTHRRRRLSARPSERARPATSSFRDATLMGDPPPTAAAAPPATTHLPPGQSDRVDPGETAQGAAANSTFSLSATGSIVPFCYPAALSPYRACWSNFRQPIQHQISDNPGHALFDAFDLHAIVHGER